MTRYLHYLVINHVRPSVKRRFLYTTRIPQMPSPVPIQRTWRWISIHFVFLSNNHSADATPGAGDSVTHVSTARHRSPRRTGPDRRRRRVDGPARRRRRWSPSLPKRGAARPKRGDGTTVPWPERCLSATDSTAVGEKLAASFYGSICIVGFISRSCFRSICLAAENENERLRRRLPSQFPCY